MELTKTKIYVDIRTPKLLHVEIVFPTNQSKEYLNLRNTCTHTPFLYCLHLVVVISALSIEFEDDMRTQKLRKSISIKMR